MNPTVNHQGEDTPSCSDIDHDKEQEEISVKSNPYHRNNKIGEVDHDNVNRDDDHDELPEQIGIQESTSINNSKWQKIILLLVPLEPLFYIFSIVYNLIPNLNFFATTHNPNPKRGIYSIIASIIVTFSTIVIFIRFIQDSFVSSMNKDTVTIIFYIAVIMAITMSCAISGLIGYHPKTEGSRFAAICKTLQIFVFIACFCNVIFLLFVSFYGILCIIKYAILYPCHLAHKIIIDYFNCHCDRDCNYNACHPCGVQSSFLRLHCGNSGQCCCFCPISNVCNCIEGVYTRQRSVASEDNYNVIVRA